ncbi:MAG: hypothetical protein BRC30_00120 [Nanohaloarchaea archaeon SW_7_46_7]|nr:MAG: hypothetical protein BRC30_00120 [Nanohaloarchaea archaeon SW_7_46_7]
MFYPQGGGQRYDVGKINGNQVEEVQKHSGAVLHRTPNHDLKEGKSIKGVVNGEKRKQLTQHHSTTHMVNAAAREELGEHIYQAGASKKLEKARLDITHYEKPDQDTLDEIEGKVRETIQEDHKINVLEMDKSEAEQEYGFRIYQGGAPPGNTIRLIDIEDVDIEACGGTHLTQTSHAEEFIVTGCKRIQDGVVRLEYKAGKAAEEYISTLLDIYEDSKEILEIDRPLNDEDKRQEVRDLAKVFSVEKKDLKKTLERFVEEKKDFRDKRDRLADFLEIEERESPEERKPASLSEAGELLFDQRMFYEKRVEKLESRIEEYVEEKADEDTVLEVPTENIGLLIQVTQKLSSMKSARITLIGDKGGVSASENNLDAREPLKERFKDVQGDKGFAKAFN